MNWQTFFNPFSKFSERTLLIAGIIITILGIYIGYISNCSFNGALNFQVLEGISLKRVAIENTINISCMTFCLFFLGKYLNTKTRLIDVFLVALIYRLPLYFNALISFLLVPKNFNEKLLKNIKTPEMVFDNQTDKILIGIFALLTVLLATYSIVLLTYGFKTATNTKKWQHYVFFTITILITIGISKYLIFRIY
jgi:hypothetical protein